MTPIELVLVVFGGAAYVCVFVAAVVLVGDLIARDE